MRFLRLRLCAALVAASVACTASASGPLVQCISGCPSKGPALKDSLIGDQWWAGPSVGLSVFARDSATKQWSSQLSFAFQYGIKWKPVWWTVTGSFLSFDLGLSAGSAAVFNNSGSPFVITLAPTITFLDFLAFGYGPRFSLSNTAGVKDQVSGVLFLGLSTSFGAP